MSDQAEGGTSSFAVDPNSSSSVHDIQKAQAHKNGMFCPTQEMWSETVRRGVAPPENVSEQNKNGSWKKVVLTIKKVQIAGTGPAYGKTPPMEEEIYFPFLHGARDFYNTPIKNNRALDLF